MRRALELKKPFITFGAKRLKRQFALPISEKAIRKDLAWTRVGIFSFTFLNVKANLGTLASDISMASCGVNGSDGGYWVDDVDFYFIAFLHGSDVDGPRDFVCDRRANLFHLSNLR